MGEDRELQLTISLMLSIRAPLRCSCRSSDSVPRCSSASGEKGSSFASAPLSSSADCSFFRSCWAFSSSGK